MRVSTTASIPDLSRAVRRAGAREVERRANRYGQQMVDAVPRVLQARGVNLGRPEHRRRHPGSQRIEEGWGYKIEGDPTTFPIYLTITASGDAAYMERIRMIDEGTTGHTITKKQSRGPGGQFGKRGYLQFPSGGAIDGPPWEYAKKVNHPGSSKGKGFIAAIMSGVIGRARGRF